MTAFRPPRFMGEGRRFMNSKNEMEIGIPDDTGQVMMLDKKERALLKLLLTVSLKSESAKKYIVKTLGSRYLEVGEKLLHNMGG